VTYSLDVVADFLCDQLGDVLDEGVLDADLVAVWGGVIVSMAFSSSDEASMLVRKGGIQLGEMIPSLVPCSAIDFSMVALRLAWFKQLPHDW
jgi:hypothetical protein